MGQADLGNLIREKSANLNKNINDTAIILAAGHGKRIKSNTSKMMHEIWGKSTVQRVAEAVSKSFECNLVIVVGVKADQVVNAVSEKVTAQFALQETQNGTGHAVQVALNEMSNEMKKGIAYVLPGDMGLIDSETMKEFKEAFLNSGNDMMVLTGLYEGKSEENYYGRILRVPEFDENGNSSGHNYGKVIEIMEFKDIKALDSKLAYRTEYSGKTYAFTKKELLENNEFNSGVFAFKFEFLTKLIFEINSNNVQGEIYLTDLIAIFNRNGLNVGAVSPTKQYVLMGFNNKSVLWEMNEIARKLVYEKIKDVVTIKDPGDFFIAEEVVEDFLNRDADGEILDIEIGRGAYLDNGVKVGSKIKLGKDVKLTGNITIGNNCVIGDFTYISGNHIIADNSKIAPFTVMK